MKQFNDMKVNYIGNTDIDTIVTTENTEAAIKNLKKGKAAGADQIVSEHIIYSHPCIVVHPG